MWKKRYLTYNVDETQNVVGMPAPAEIEHKKVCYYWYLRVKLIFLSIIRFFIKLQNILQDESMNMFYSGIEENWWLR